jgi:serine/threonine protein kinase
MTTNTSPSPSGIIGRRYLLHEQIGSGGMGIVYRATDRLAGHIVALKQVTAPAQALLFTSRSEGLDLRLALAQEFKLLASMRHPHIISVLDYGFDEQHQPFYTMEFLENPQTIFQAGAAQPLDAKIGLLAQMLQALAYLHRRGVIHHDLKPSNVMVVDGQVKLLDFGLSLTAEQGGRMGSTAAGTLAYMAPEVLQGAGASQASDLYAVGVMAYELLAGRHPFNLDDMTQLITTSSLRRQRRRWTWTRVWARSNGCWRKTPARWAMPLR